MGPMGLMGPIGLMGDSHILDRVSLPAFAGNSDLSDRSDRSDDSDILDRVSTHFGHRLADSGHRMNSQ